MTIMVTGGGSGGHITPLLAVAKQIKKTRPEVTIVYVGQTGDKFAEITNSNKNIDQSFTIRAGKFRRYHGQGWRQVLDLPTITKNTRDFFYVLIGLVQSISLLRKVRPNAVFIKGGFVGVPVGLAAAILKIPYVTHDSDSVPGLANRIVARWTSWHAVALDKSIYPYPQEKTISTGIPVQADFIRVADKLKAEYRKTLKIPSSSKLLFIIGGGLGSQTINSAVIDTIPHLLEEFKDLYVVHSVGHNNYDSMKKLYSEILNSEQQSRVQPESYISDVYVYSGAADLIITRAGATNLAEFAIQGRACIVIPSPYLAGGHQIKNAKYLEEKGAIATLSEEQIVNDSNRLADLTSKLLKDDAKRRTLGENLAKFAKPNATEELAKLIIDTADTK